MYSLFVLSKAQTDLAAYATVLRVAASTSFAPKIAREGPSQNNGHDCGIFCCLVAFHTLIEGRPLIELGQDFVDYAQTWFAYFILSSMYF